MAITSDELIHLKQQPKQLVVVGGGFIGLEFGFALARAGSKVVVLQSGPRIAPALDDEIRDILLESARQAGIEIKTNVKVKNIGADMRVDAEIASTTTKFPADQVLSPLAGPPTSSR
jgi:pyruvate/2-oxoglutarate dehydrogenase complex dihydrolipoamide dehydrogenase (E3) component